MNERAQVARMTDAQLQGLIYHTDDDALLEAALDELEARSEYERTRDWTEQDARAAVEDRIENMRREY